MYLYKSVESVISTVFDKFNNFNKPQDPPAWNGQGETGSSKLRFHSAAYGKAITFNDDFSEAIRDEEYFEHSVIFSHRPINTNEMIAVEILELTADFHGPLRIGFTSCNPSTFQNGVVPLGRDLRCMDGFWLKSVRLFPIITGSVIYLKLDSNGTVLYGVDGANGGVFLKNVDVTKPLWVVLEAYGAVRSLKFVDKSMLLTNINYSYFDVDENSSPNNSRITPCRRGQVGRGVLFHPATTPLNARRNVRLAPLQNIPPTPSNGESSLTLNSPMTPAFQSPNYSFSLGLCIMCIEHEKDTAFTDCGHLCMCYTCAKTFKDQIISSGRTRQKYRRNICPMCRQPIKDVLKIYT